MTIIVSYSQDPSSARTILTAKPCRYPSRTRHPLYSNAIMADTPPDPPPCNIHPTSSTHNTPVRVRSAAPASAISASLAQRLNIITDTPRRVATAASSNHHSGSAAKANDKSRNNDFFYEWLKYHKAFDADEDGTIEAFLRKYVPTNAPLIETKTRRFNKLQEAASLVKESGDNGSEINTYDPLTQLLNQCQTDFKASMKIEFRDKHTNYLSGPTDYDHDTAPDILGAFPGRAFPEVTADWDEYAIAVEVKTDDDPVEPTTDTVVVSRSDTIVQLVKNARSLLFASSSCFIFVIGVYTSSERMRIYRFDRSGSVSCGFNYRERPDMIREFLYRLTHPSHGIRHSIVGWDETIRIPTTQDITKMQKVVEKFDPKVVLDEHSCRWVKVRLNHDPFFSRKLSEDSNGSTSSTAETTPNPAYYDLEGFTFGEPLYKSSGLVSRATFVSRILVEVPGYGFQEFVMKDAWHQKNRRPESKYYERIQERYPELKTKSEFDWVKAIYPNIDSDPNWIPGLPEYYGYLDLFTMDSPREAAYDRGHLTVTFQLLNNNKLSERSRARSLTGPVGRPITDYPCTKDLVTAMRDAIVGHFIARSCGVLHRDISVGNMLFVKTPAGVQGFLHDFDYATFVPCDFGLEKSADKDDLEHQKNPDKELTGTPQFLAVEMLGKQYEMQRHQNDEIVDEKVLKLKHMAHHDLESFYWVLVWIILRYSDKHNKSRDVCSRLFDQGDTFSAKSIKMGWLVPAEEPFTVIQNDPLKSVLENLRDIVRMPYIVKNNKIYPMHDSFVKVLDDGTNLTGWPVDDCKKDFVPPNGKDERAGGKRSVSSEVRTRSSLSWLLDLEAEDPVAEVEEMSVVEDQLLLPTLPASMASEPPQSNVSAVDSLPTNQQPARVSERASNRVSDAASSGLLSSRSLKRRSSALEDLEESPKRKIRRGQ